MQTSPLGAPPPDVRKRRVAGGKPALVDDPFELCFDGSNMDDLFVKLTH